MKKLVISFKPSEIKKIEEGKKTVDIRKCKPKYGDTFRCYIYCTKSGAWGFTKEELKPERKEWRLKFRPRCGMIVGEFVCDYIKNCRELNPWDVSAESGMDSNDIWQYGKSGRCGKVWDFERMFAWHITDVKIYDKPQPIWKFGIHHPTDNFKYLDDDFETNFIR